ncbi:MAG TPA: lysophospholipid acyltransferase family protein, partial [Verrucomicrobiae bacterium]
MSLYEAVGNLLPSCGQPRPFSWFSPSQILVFNVEVETQGPIPSSGLLVCNHLSYLDILVLGALAPAAFVAKREVKFWPILGWFATLARAFPWRYFPSLENLPMTNTKSSRPIQRWAG